MCINISNCPQIQQELFEGKPLRTFKALFTIIIYINDIIINRSIHCCDMQIAMNWQLTLQLLTLRKSNCNIYVRKSINIYKLQLNDFSSELNVKIRVSSLRRYLSVCNLLSVYCILFISIDNTVSVQNTIFISRISFTIVLVRTKHLFRYILSIIYIDILKV